MSSTPTAPRFSASRSRFLVPGIGHDVLALGQQPGEGELGGGALFLAGQFLHPVHELQVAGKVFALEPGRVPAEVVGGEVVSRADLAGQEAAAQRAVGHKTDPQFLEHRKDLGFGFAFPQ